MQCGNCIYNEVCKRGTHETEEGYVSKSCYQEQKINSCVFQLYHIHVHTNTSWGYSKRENILYDNNKIL